MVQRERPEQFVYDGVEGQTRRETLVVHTPSGALRSLEVYRVVNVATHPKLGRRALEGRLHHFAELGFALAIPFVYHDPGARCFVLVVPPALAHTVLAERAALLARLAEDSAHRVPGYVALAEAVIGAAGLELRLATPREEQADAREGARIRALQQELDERERRLTRRSDALAAKADELRRWEERLRSLRRELDARDQGLERGGTASYGQPPLPEDESVVMTGGTVVEDLASSVKLVDDATASVEQQISAELEYGPEFDEVASVHTSDYVDDFRDTGVQEGAFEEEYQEADYGDEGTVEADVEALEELDDLGSAVQLVEEIEDVSMSEATSLHESVEAPPSLGTKAPKPPPDAFFADPTREMMAVKAEEGVALYVRLPEGLADGFRVGSVELLLQYLVIDEVPIVVLTLVEWRPPSPLARRFPVDPGSEEGRALLEALGPELHVAVALFGSDGRYERTIEVTAPERRSNLHAILRRVEEDAGEGDRDAAIERALSAPPPLTLRGHPFHVDSPASTAREAFAGVASLTKWSAPPKLDLARLGLSIPEATIESAFRRVLSDAFAFGLALPKALLARALELRLATDPADALSHLMTSFRETAAREDRGGLSSEVVARNWVQLLDAAKEHELSVAPEILASAERDRSLSRTRLDPAGASTEELLKLADEGASRLSACLEILERGDPTLLPVVSRSMRKMRRAEVLEVLPRFVACGESAEDPLIDALGARKTFVRQGAALALGELRLRRSIAPLVRLLQTEPTDVWYEVGRVLGNFPASALQSLVDAAREPECVSERLSYALAHVAVTAEPTIRAFGDDESPTLRRIAHEALTHRQLASQHQEVVSPRTDHVPEEAIRKFSLSFYQALEGARTASHPAPSQPRELT